MLGKAAEAKVALAIMAVATEGMEYPPSTVIHEATRAYPGWRYLGSGISRYAFLSPSGVVYKVAKADFYTSHNENEHKAATGVRKLLKLNVPSAKRMRDYIAVPETRIFASGVLAMEYLGDEEQHDGGPAIKCFKHLGIGLDTHPGNLRRTPDGKVAMIDLGHENPSLDWVKKTLEEKPAPV